MRKKEKGFAFLDPAHAGGESEKPSQRKIVTSGVTTPAPESVNGEIEEQGEKKKSKKKKDGDDKSKTEDSKVSGGKSKRTEEVKEDVKPKTNVDRANAALKEEYHFSETDLANFVDENALSHEDIGSLVKLVQYKMVAKLVESHVRVKDLAHLTLYKLFLKHSQQDPAFLGVRTLPLEKYSDFLAELRQILAPFDEIHPHINRDLVRLDKFDEDMNLADNQFQFASYIRNVQKCLSFPDLIRLCKINTCLGFSDDVAVDNPTHDPEMRAFIDDFRSKHKTNHISLFKARKPPGSKGTIPARQFCWLFHDMFGGETSIRFSRQAQVASRTEKGHKSEPKKSSDSVRSHGGDSEVRQDGRPEIIDAAMFSKHKAEKADEETVPLKRDNSQEFILNQLHTYFFEYLGLNQIMHHKASLVDINFDFFWNIVYYFLETKIFSYLYTRRPENASLDTKETLKRTLEEYKQKLADSTDPQVQTALKHTIDFLQQQIDKLERPEEKAANKLREQQGNWKKALKEIFLFYSKQQKVAKKDKTFDNYKDELTNMSVGEWLRFCKDFGLNPQHWEKREVDQKVKEKIDMLAKEVNNHTLNSVYKLESMGNLGIGYDSFEKILKKVCLKLSDVYGFEEEKLFDAFSRMGLLDGQYKDRMRMINKPFFNALHYPSMQPFKKEDNITFKVKVPNALKNQEVFNRLYDQALSDNQTRQIINDLNSQAGTSGKAVVINQQGQLEFEGGQSVLSPMQERKSSAGILRSGNTASQHLLGSADPSIPGRGLKGGNRARKGRPVFYLDNPDSYVIRERARHLQDNNKKFTWEHLERMNINELKGLTQVNFDPASLIGAEDDEDRLYMQEYAKVANTNRHVVERHDRDQRNLQHYGDIKKNSQGGGQGGGGAGGNGYYPAPSDSPNSKSQNLGRPPALPTVKSHQSLLRPPNSNNGNFTRAGTIAQQINEKHRQSLENASKGKPTSNYNK